MEESKGGSPAVSKTGNDAHYLTLNDEMDTLTLVRHTPVSNIVEPKTFLPFKAVPGQVLYQLLNFQTLHFSITTIDSHLALTLH
jgi:hypothetical protein